MLSPTLDTIRLFLHVFAAAVWVGGQVVLAALVPRLRDYDGATKVAARGFAMVAWPAFFVVVVTGMWSLAEVEIGDTTTTYQVTVMIKVTLAVLSGAAAAVHAVGNSIAAKAVGGSLGLLGALGAMFFGLLLRSGV